MKATRTDPRNVDLEFLRDEFNRFRSEVAGMKDKMGANASDALDQMSHYLNGKNVSSKLSALETEIEALTWRSANWKPRWATGRWPASPSPSAWACWPRSSSAGAKV